MRDISNELTDAAPMMMCGVITTQIDPSWISSIVIVLTTIAVAVFSINKSIHETRKSKVENEKNKIELKIRELELDEIMIRKQEREEDRLNKIKKTAEL